MNSAGSLKRSTSAVEALSGIAGCQHAAERDQGSECGIPVVGSSCAETAFRTAGRSFPVIGIAPITGAPITGITGAAGQGDGDRDCQHPQRHGLPATFRILLV